MNLSREGGSPIYKKGYVTKVAFIGVRVQYSLFDLFLARRYSLHLQDKNSNRTTTTIDTMAPWTDDEKRKLIELIAEFGELSQSGGMYTGFGLGSRYRNLSSIEGLGLGEKR